MNKIKKYLKELKKEINDILDELSISSASSIVRLREICPKEFEIYTDEEILEMYEGTLTKASIDLDVSCRELGVEVVKIIKKFVQ